MRNIQINSILVHIAFIVVISQCLASDRVMTYELCNRTIAFFDLVDAVVEIKEIDETIVGSKLLTYQDYQSLKSNWPGYLQGLGLDMPDCKAESTEFEINALADFHFFSDKILNLTTGTGRFYQSTRPENLTIDEQTFTGTAHYSSSEIIEVKNVQVEPDAHVMFHTGKAIVLKDGFHAKPGCSLRVFVSGY